MTTAPRSKRIPDETNFPTPVQLASIETQEYPVQRQILLLAHLLVERGEIMEVPRARI